MRRGVIPSHARGAQEGIFQPFRSEEMGDLECAVSLVGWSEEFQESRISSGTEVLGLVAVAARCIGQYKVSGCQWDCPLRPLIVASVLLLSPPSSHCLLPPIIVSSDLRVDVCRCALYSSRISPLPPILSSTTHRGGQAAPFPLTSGSPGDSSGLKDLGNY